MDQDEPKQPNDKSPTPSQVTGASSSSTELFRPGLSGSEFQKATTSTQQRTPQILSREEEERQLLANGIAGRYEVIRRLKDGGMGEVYVGKHKAIQKTVAIKILSAPHRYNPELVQRFLQEARAASAIQHDHIVDIIDFGETDQGSVFFAMEYLEGEDLAVRIQKQANEDTALSWSEASNITLQVLDALDSAHARGVIHRDLKPENIFLVKKNNGNESVKVLDFGIAKVKDPNFRSSESTSENSPAPVSGLTKTGIVMGTPHYMSPEQSQGLNIDARSDLYSVGTILYEMLSGRPPFDGSNPISIITQHLSSEADELPNLPDPGINQLLQKAMAKQPADRFESAAEMARTILELGGRTSTQLPTFVSEPSNRSTGLNDLSGTPLSGPDKEAPRRSFALIAAGACVLALGLGTSFVLKSDDDRSSLSPEEQPLNQPNTSEPSQQNSQSLHEKKVVSTPTPVENPCPKGMVLISSGKFFMGSMSEHPILKSAKPQHQVELNAYCMDRTEVTVEAYRKCSAIGDCQRAYKKSLWPQGSMKKSDWERAKEVYSSLCNENDDTRGQHPINCVTWKQADQYCKNKGLRLPSEAEWEFAARGSDGRVYPWGDDKPSVKHANVCGKECEIWRQDNQLSSVTGMHENDDAFAGTSPVGTFPQGNNQHGQSDIIGNVFEWTADAFRPYTNDGESPKDTNQNTRVIRGGAFNSTMPEFADPALRFGLDEQAHSHGVGFRCASDAGVGSTQKASTAD